MAEATIEPVPIDKPPCIGPNHDISLLIDSAAPRSRDKEDVTGTGTVTLVANVVNAPTSYTTFKLDTNKKDSKDPYTVTKISAVSKAAYYYDEIDFKDPLELQAAREALANALKSSPSADFIILPRFEITTEENKGGTSFNNEYGCTDYNRKVTVTLHAKAIRLKSDAEH